MCVVRIEVSGWHGFVVVVRSGNGYFHCRMFPVLRAFEMTCINVDSEILHYRMRRDGSVVFEGQVMLFIVCVIGPLPLIILVFLSLSCIALPFMFQMSWIVFVRICKLGWCMCVKCFGTGGWLWRSTVA